MIEIEHLGFSYGDQPVLEDVCIRVEPGDFVGLIGPNGGGKTTLLKLILGLLQPREGRIRVFGVAPTPGSTRVGWVPQHHETPEHFPVSAQEVVMMGLLGCGRRFGPFGRGERGQARAILERLGIGELAGRRMDGLSGGQRQRVLIGRALVSRPELLLLDEPTANVDPKAEGEILDLLKDLGREVTILMVSHDLGFVSAHVNRVACVNVHLACHTTAGLTGEVIENTYRRKLDLVIHDHGASPH